MDSESLIYKPQQCMMYMQVEMHPSLLGAQYCTDVRGEVLAAGARVVVAPDLCDPALVLWTRTIPPGQKNCRGEVSQTESKESADCALYVLPADIVAEHVRDRSLASHLTQVAFIAGKTVTLVIVDVKEYFKSSKRKTQNSTNRLMTEIDLEMAKTDLLVSTDCDTLVTNSPNELALLITQFTKAIAEAPYKKAKNAVFGHAGYYMRGDNKNCVAVDKDGLGLTRLWQQMLAVLPMSSLETARALCNEYPSPRDLYGTITEKSVIDIAKIGVARTAVPGARTRRIGPEFAKKLYTLFTSEDGDVLLD